MPADECRLLLLPMIRIFNCAVLHAPSVSGIDLSSVMIVRFRFGLAAFFLSGCFILCGQDPEWTGEHRVFENRFYISPWPENPESALLFSREQVVEFISHIGNPNFKDGGDLQEYQFASLAPGKMHLVAVIQSGGTIGANTILIAHCKAARCVEDYIESGPPIDLTMLLVSARQDGVKQMLTEEWGNASNSAARVVFGYDLYELGPKGPEKVTQKYVDWYMKTVRQRLEAQKAETMAEQADEGEASDERLAAIRRESREFRRAAAEYALARFNDSIGATKESLIQHAVKWSRSEFGDVQELAVLAVRCTSKSELQQQILEQLRKSDKVKHLLNDRPDAVWEK